MSLSMPRVIVCAIIGSLALKVFYPLRHNHSCMPSAFLSNQSSCFSSPLLFFAYFSKQFLPSHKQRNAKALVDLARAEKDPAVKRDLVQKLSVMRAPEATDYMLELLK